MINQTIIEIRKTASLIFNDKKYKKFFKYLEIKDYNNARLLLEKQIEKLENPSEFKVTYHLEYLAADRLLDLIIDLIMNKEDVGRRKIESTIT